MKQGRDLVSDAVKDAQSLRAAVLETAKNEIIESMAPALKRLLEQNIRGVRMTEDQDRLRRGVQDNWPGESHTGFEEGKSKGEDAMNPKDGMDSDKELDMESLAGFFPQLAETGDADEKPACEPPPPVEDEGMTYDESSIPTLGEASDDSDEDMDEEIEISEAELRKVYEAALQTEVEVKKGFSDMTKNGELADVVKDAGKSVADVKDKSPAGWETQEPPAKQDYSVKEMIQRGLAENRTLRKKLGEATSLIKVLGTRLHEVNLFNSKVMHVNRILNAPQRLTNEQKRVVMESIDKARSINEVKMVYETIVGSFKASQSLQESKGSRKPRANAQRPQSSGSPDQKVLRESVDRGGDKDKYSRLRQLAGLVK